jgi:putative RecB family exonuclease
MEHLLNQPLSASRLNQFESCQLAFRFKYIDKLPEPPGAAAFRGSVVHLALEKLYGLDPADRVVAAAVDFLPTALDELLSEHPVNAVAIDSQLTWPSDEYVASDAAKQDFLAECKPLVENYFKVEDPSTLNPKALEYRVSGKSRDGHTLNGYIDRLEESPEGYIRISDYKSGATPPPRFRDKAWFQLQIYAWLIQQETGTIAKELKLIYLKHGEAITNSPTQEDLTNVENRVISIAEAISAAVTERSFHPKESPLCNYCNFQELCPAKGGTAPPLPY